MCCSHTQLSFSPMSFFPVCQSSSSHSSLAPSFSSRSSFLPHHHSCIFNTLTTTLAILATNPSFSLSAYSRSQTPSLPYSLLLQTAAHRSSSGKPGANYTLHPANNESPTPPIRSSLVMPRVQMDDHFPQSHRNTSHSGAGTGINSSNSSGSGSQDFFLSSGDLHQPSTMNQSQQGQVRPFR